MFCQPLTVVCVCHSQPLLKEEMGGVKGGGVAWLFPLPSWEFPEAEIFYLDGNFLSLFLSKLAYLPLSSETNKLWTWMYLSVKLKLTAACQMTTAFCRIKIHTYIYILFTVMCYIYLYIHSTRINYLRSTTFTYNNNIIWSRKVFSKLAAEDWVKIFFIQMKDSSNQVNARELKPWFTARFIYETGLSAAVILNQSFLTWLFFAPYQTVTLILLLLIG